MWQLLPSKGKVVLCLALAGLAGWVASPGAAAGCGSTPGLTCSQVEVALDRAGRVPGSVSLHVEVLPAVGTPRGVLFLLAGGPGQASAEVFGLGSPSSAGYYRYLFPGYTLVAFDGRGTGKSGALDCPAFRTMSSDTTAPALGAACAGSLGPQRDFYGTGDQAEDIDAVRQALGVDRVALWGTSYGTKLAVAYALAHPDRVERLVLDSVVPPELPETFGGNVLQMLPQALADYCGPAACRAATADFAGDVVALARSLQSAPLSGKVRRPNGSARVERLSEDELVQLVLGADLDPGLAAELPAAVHAARHSNPAPLLRLADLVFGGSGGGDGIDDALFAATVCRDGLFPWQPETPIEQRGELLQAAFAAGSFGPFGAWAAEVGEAGLCLDWPSAQGGTPIGAGPLPDVPVLALSGGSDMRTPTVDAASVVARFPQGHLLVVPGVGHAVLEANASCAQGAVRDWILGRPVPGRCPRPAPLVAPLAAYPRAVSHRLSPAQTLGLAEKTIREACATWLLASGSGTGSATVTGLGGGTLRTSGNRAFVLKDYSLVPGVTLDGKLKVSADRLPLTFDGRLTVGGAAAAPGPLVSVARHLFGRLGGKPVYR